jgi:hypothetical protein
MMKDAQLKTIAVKCGNKRGNGKRRSGGEMSNAEESRRTTGEDRIKPGNGNNDNANRMMRIEPGKRP